MKPKIEDTAVSEIIGAILLLAMAVSVFSVIYMNVLADDGPDSNVFVTIVGKIENNDVVFEHITGESLGLNTSVRLNIGGIEEYFILSDPERFENQYKNDKVWNIGERLVYSIYNLSFPSVQSTIVDKESNSVVWWGTLKPGGFYTLLGARWYFDENEGKIAHDSLNENHGSLIPENSGPEWDDQNYYNGTSALEFYGNESVYVKGDTLSLNYIKNLSIEAYFKFPDYNYITNNIFGSPFGIQPNIIHVYKDIYAVAFLNKSDGGHHGNVKTINISSKNGSIIKNIYNDQITFDDSTGFWPKICHVSDEVYIIAYGNNDKDPQYVHLQTLKIANNGTVGPLLGSFNLGKSEVFDHEIIKLSDNHIVLVYRNGTNKAHAGMIKTFNIANNGLSISKYKTFEFDKLNASYDPDIVHVFGNIYAIAYADKDKNGLGILKTINITPDGIINKVIDNYIFDSINGTHDPDIKLISNSTFVITYSDDDERGLLATVEISEDGTITKKVIDTLVYENHVCMWPKIISMVDDFFVVTFEGDQQNGWIVVCKIDDNGLIEDNLLSKFIFNDATKNLHGDTPDIIKVSDNIYANAYNVGSFGGTAQEGHVRTFALTDAIDSNMPKINRGIICKEDTWGIYVNKTNVVVTIGTTTITKNYTFNEGIWNRLVLSYDQSFVKLYCNTNPNPIINEYYPFNTNNPSKDIFIGKSFRGIIDHVCIYDGIYNGITIQ